MTERADCANDGNQGDAAEAAEIHGPVRGRSVTNKVGAILRSFAGGRPERSLAEVADFADLPMSTAHRLLAELIDCGLLGRLDNGRYHAGGMLHLLVATRSAGAGHRARIGLALEDLTVATGYRARFGVLRGDLFVSYLERPTDAGKDPCVPGRTLLPARTALGMAILAHSPQQTIEHLVRRELRHRKIHTPSSVAQLHHELATIRQRGVAVARRPHPEAAPAAVAAPVFGCADQVVGALELALPATMPDGARDAGPALLVAARGLSRWFAESAAHVPTPLDLTHLTRQTDSAGALTRVDPHNRSRTAV